MTTGRISPPPTAPPTVAHDSMNCNYGPDGGPCEMCRWANGEEYEPMTKDKGTVAATEIVSLSRCGGINRDGVAPVVCEVVVGRVAQIINERDQLIVEVARLKRILNPIVACYRLGLSPEKFVDRVGPWIEEVRAALSSEKE